MLDIKSLEGKRIAVLLSGGVDSSVVLGVRPSGLASRLLLYQDRTRGKGRVGLLF